ncbi:MAG TPA: thioester reductase domain-containing protein, partial [Polyangiaceae bacterium]|nr:thioester reductase domain-containing protein [Polyangiaceae bacterium]
YLLRELLDQTSLRVVCLVRAEDDHAATLRLRVALRARGLSLSQLSERVQVLAADLARPRLGLSERGFQHLVRECDVIYHAAASVSLARGYASVRGVNVLGAAELLRLAMAPRQKPVHHLSTLAVAFGEPDASLLEQPVALHAGLRDGYTQSKWAAEALMHGARGRGLPVSIYRLGRVVGPESGRDVNADDLVFRTLRVGLALGTLPDLPVCEPWTPVERVAAAVVQLSRGTRPAPIYHLAPARLTRLSDVCAALCDQYALSRCTLAEFCAALRRAPDSLDKSVLGFFEAQADSDALTSVLEVRRDNLLRDLTDGERAFPEVEAALLRSYFAFCVESGLFPAPPARR